jgi:hypothetical protein
MVYTSRKLVGDRDSRFPLKIEGLRIVSASKMRVLRKVTIFSEISDDHD